MNAYLSKLHSKLNYINTSVTKFNFIELRALLIVLLGLAVMYIPSFVDLFKGIWSTDQQGHGPIVLAISAWFFYYKAKQLAAMNFVAIPAPQLGWPILILGCVLFIVGRSQSLYIFEVGSLILVLLGIVLLFYGVSIAKHFWFAFFFMLFMVPLPASIVDVVTQPMKLAVSFASEHLLYFLGYPVARSGVVVYIGSYQLLVADACAGLNSLFTLEALGLLYMNVMRHESPLRNMLLAALIVPISFTSNVTRVVILALITYYWGDEAGQGFIHEFSGMLLFITALLLIMGVDSLLRLISKQLELRHKGNVNKTYGDKKTYGKKV
ncbi:MAG: exosortase B [Methylotenera sp.]|nr:exosortase B [Methylotenera sp.]